MIDIDDLIEPRLEQIVLPTLSTFLRPHRNPRHCSATAMESRPQRQINLQGNRQNAPPIQQNRILQTDKNRFSRRRGAN
jgi:hypothetical protein